MADPMQVGSVRTPRFDSDISWLMRQCASDSHGRNLLFESGLQVHEQSHRASVRIGCLESACGGAYSST